MIRGRSATVRTLVVAFAVLAVTVMPAASVALGATDATTDGGTAGAGWTVSPQTDGGDGPTIRQRGIVSPAPASGTVSLAFEYAIPPSVSGLRVGIGVVALDGVTVASTEGFERIRGGLFQWDGETETPRIGLEMSVGDRRVRGATRDGWALVFEPRTRIRTRSVASPVRTDSFEVAAGTEGHASGSIAYLGPHERRNATVADERVTFVIAAEGADPARAIEFLRTANERFDFGVERDSLTVFVLPTIGSADRQEQGTTIDTGIVITERGLRFDESGAVLPHEYVHTRFGTLGRGSAAWLTEAHAEYYGRLFALNDGVGSYESFREGLRASEYGEDGRAVTLSEPGTWEGTTAHYAKGAHVLAALDALIRERTNGTRTLRDVFEGRTDPFPGYQTFKLAVVDVADDPAVGKWLDRYVTTDALPPLPAQPRYYVADPTLDPDGDGLSSGRELERGRHPFVAGAGELPDVTRESGRNGTTDAPATTDGGAPGFGVSVGLLALTLLVLAAGAATPRP
jgi:hypothetical protein